MFFLIYKIRFLLLQQKRLSMKTHKILILIGMMGLLFSLIGCKKGENDPTLSLRSRKARLVGKWVLEEGNMTLNENYKATQSSQGYSQTINQTTLINSTFNSGTLMETYSETHTSGGQTATLQYAMNQIHKETLEFNKDQSFEMLITSNGTLNYSGTAMTVSLNNTLKGSWAFGKKNKETDVKNKETVILTLDDYILTMTTISGGQSFAQTITRSSTGTAALLALGSNGFAGQSMVLKITQLKEKELVIEFEGSTTDNNNETQSTYNETESDNIQIKGEKTYAKD